MSHIVIIGNGISGITTARFVRKQSNHKVTVISSETDHFFSRTALMYIYMGHMKYHHIKPYEDWFWGKNKIELVRDHVELIETSSRMLTCTSGKSIHYDKLVIATGSISNKFGWPGQNLNGVQGLYSYQDLEMMEAGTRNISRAVVVGGGLIGVEMAEMLHSRNIDVTMLVREKQFWNNILPLEEATLISKHILSHKIDLRLETTLKEITGKGGRVTSVTTETGDIIPCEFVGLTVGVSPNVAFLKNSGITVNRGVLVNEFLETNIADVYAAGDCVERTYELAGRRSIEQVWYTGRMMGEVLAQTLCGRRTRYEPGPWFNSAKFFDIEYQTYGNVAAQAASHESDFYWEHPDGQKALHFVWETATREFTGINAFGIRLRHECFDRWIRNRESIDFVIAHLKEANFDPEFFVRHEPQLTKAYQTANPTRSSEGMAYSRTVLK